MKNIILLIVVSLVLLIASTPISAGDNGGMNVSMGYTIIDDYDNPSVNQETFNTYEGFGLSIDDFTYKMNNGIQFNGNFYNTTLNNRNIRVSAFKSGLFKLSFYNNQYRRIYDATGTKYTRREATGIKGDFQPSKNFKIFGGFNYSDKDGITSYITRPVVLVDERAVNFTNYTYNFGASAFNKNGKISLDYKTFVSQNDEIPGFMNDREATQFNLIANTFIPSNENIHLFAGYLSREDKMDSLTTTLKTTNMWGAVRYYLNDQVRFNYRLVLTSSEHEENASTTDNNFHTASVQKDWKNLGGVRVGFELQSSEDEINSTKTNGLIVDGWYNHNATWFFRGRYSAHKREIDKGSVLINDSEKAKHLFSVKYLIKNYGSMSGKLEKRIKRYNDIDDFGNGLVSSEADYTKASFKLSLKDKRYGKIIFSNSYFLGKFENLSDTTSYEFSDHVLSTTIYPKSVGDFDIMSGASYYRSRRDLDVEKFNFTGSVTWNFRADHQFVVSYQAFTFDDLLVSADTYTSNIIEIKVIKNLTF